MPHTTHAAASRVLTLFRLPSDIELEPEREFCMDDSEDGEEEKPKLEA